MHNWKRWSRRVAVALAGLGAAAGLSLIGRADSSVQTLPFSQNWSDTGLITTNDVWTGVPGIEGFRGDNLTTANDVDPRTVLSADDPGVPDVNANQTNPDTFSTGGVTEFHLADPAIALTGSGTADAPYIRLSVSTAGIAGVRVRYTLRDLDGSTDNAVQQVALHYRVGTSGAWTDVPAAYVADATAGPSLSGLTTPVDVTLPPAVDNQTVVQLRILTTNASGNDEWVGIDDLVVEAATAPTAPVITATAAAPNPVEWGQTVVLRATVAPGTNPPSASLTVTADASAVGGPGLLPLLDDGVAPDGTAGDLVFTGETTVSAAAGTGARSVPMTALDHLARLGTGAVVVQVTQPVMTVSIADIQGSGATSPLAGQVVRTRGVVTARKFNGVFIQVEPGGEDGDPATSDGVFVFTGSTPPATLVAGDVVSVVGTIAEFVPSADPASPPLTEITSPAFTTVGTSPLPAPVTLTPADLDPAGGALQLERLEGMLVVAASLTAVAPTQGTVSEPNATGSNNGVFYAVLTGTPRPVREPGIEAMDPVLPCANGGGCAIPVFDQNPERLRVDADAIIGVPAVAITTGAVLTGVTAVVDYGFRTWTLLPTVPLAPSGLAAAAAARPRAADEFTVASFNLQRLFDTVNDPAIGEPVLTPAAYSLRLGKLSRAVRDYLHAPDILGVQEAENLTVLQDLAARIDADALAAGQPAPGYTAHLLEGNDVGGIDVGVLVGARVSVESVTQHGRDDTYVNPLTGLPELLNDRPSISVRARLAPAPGTLPAEVVIVVNHLRSLNGISDVPDGARVRAKRLAQAEYVARLLDGLRATYPGVPVVSVGDYNAFEVNDGYVDVLGVARGVPAPATEVVAFAGDLLTPDFALAPAVAGTPADQTYSYSFDGNAQSLDHILLSPEAAAALAGFDHARVNADFPEIYRGDASRVERTSDHDPAVAYLRYPRDVTPPVLTVPADLRVPAQGPNGALVSFVVTAADDVDGPVDAVCVPASGSLFPYGPTTVTCTAVDGAGNTGTAGFTVTVADPVSTGLMTGAALQRRPLRSTTAVFSAVRTSTGATGASVIALGRDGHGRPAVFVATRVDGVGFFDDPATQPGSAPASGIDTARVVGAGVVNGVPGYTFELVATDRGEPGPGRDDLAVTVRDAHGALVFSSSGAIDAGNIDSVTAP